MKINLDELTREWSYRVHTGIPDPKDSGHVNTLREILEEKKYPRRFIEKLLGELDLVKNKDSGNIYTVDKANKEKHSIVKKNASQSDVEKHTKGDSHHVDEPKSKEGEDLEDKRDDVKSQEKQQIEDWLASVPDSIKQDADLVKKLTRTIQNRSIEKTWDDNMSNGANITNATFGKRSAPQEIFNILSGNEDLQNYDAYDKPSYDVIGKKGNLMNTFSKSRMSYESLKELLSMFGSESGRGVGKGETFLSMMLDDVKMADAGAGDLDWNGKYLEVKGSGARVGKRERIFPREFEKTRLGKMASAAGSDSKFITKVVTSIASDSGADREELLQAILEFEEVAHPNGDAAKYFTTDILDDPIEVRKAFTKNLMANYAAEHGLDKLIFINTKEVVKRSKDGEEYLDRNPAFGNFVTGSPGEDIDRFVDEGLLVTANLSLDNLDPAISKP